MESCLLSLLWPQRSACFNKFLLCGAKQVIKDSIFGIFNRFFKAYNGVFVCVVESKDADNTNFIYKVTGK